MADSEFQVESMGEIYAQALINEAQKQGGNVLAEVVEDVRGIGELLKTNKLFLAFTQAVAIREEEQDAVIDKIFKGRIHALTLSVLKSMARRGRIMFLRGLVEGILAIQKKMGGIVDVELTSASAIRPETLDRVKASLAKTQGGAAEITVKIDPKLLGGMTLRIGDMLIDGSVATQLERMEEQLKRGANVKVAEVVG